MVGPLSKPESSSWLSLFLSISTSPCFFVCLFPVFLVFVSDQFPLSTPFGPLLQFPYSAKPSCLSVPYFLGRPIFPPQVPPVHSPRFHIQTVLISITLFPPAPTPFQCSYQSYSLLPMCFPTCFPHQHSVPASPAPISDSKTNHLANLSLTSSISQSPFPVSSNSSPLNHNVSLLNF